MLPKFSKPLFALIILLAALLFPSACALQPEHHVNMAPMADMPDYVQSAKPKTQEAYQFAVANPEMAKQLPCYCGCRSRGHESLYACYVSHADETGVVEFDKHALYCGICVDTAQDAIRLMKEGKTAPEIKAYVDETYSKFDPSYTP